MRPVARLIDERKDAGQATAEDEGVDRHAMRIVPGRIEARALGGGHGEPCIRVRRRHVAAGRPVVALPVDQVRSEEHTSELQSLMSISYAVFCLKNKQTHIVTIY